MTKISKDHYQYPWTNDMLLLTCIFRLRIQPVVPYYEIADIFMHSLSDRLSGLPSTWAKTHNKSEKWMKSWLVQCLEENFKGAEFRGDQVWYSAKHVDAELVGEMVRAAGLDKKGYKLAEAEEMKLQIHWRRNGDWRAASIPNGEGIVQPGVGTIGHRQR